MIWDNDEYVIKSYLVSIHIHNDAFEGLWALAEVCTPTYMPDVFAISL